MFSANVESKPTPPVGDVIAEHDPDLVVLTEAYNCRDHLTSLADRYGYVLRQFGTGTGAEGPDIAALVRVGIPLLRREAMKMTEPWWGPSTGKKREPRVYVELTLGDDQLAGGRWQYLLVHYPPGGPKGGTSSTLHGKNKAAWAESRDRSAGYGNGLPPDPFAIVGDLNATHDEVAAELVPLLDRSATVASLGKVDHAVVCEAKVSRVQLESPVGHGWGLYTLTVTP